MTVKELIKALRALEGSLNKQVYIEGCDGCAGLALNVSIDGKDVLIERLERS